jgi:carboxymethylenebutenolidase
VRVSAHVPSLRAMQTRDVELTTADGPMRLYEAVPDGPAKGAVVVIQEAFGVNSHIEDVTERAAAAGWHAVAPDMFHRAGGGTAPYDDFSKVMPLYEGVTDDGILVDVDAAVAHLRQAGFADRQIGIVGFCFGGRVTFLVAARRAIGAAVTFYGGGIVSKNPLGFEPLVDEAGALQTPWLGLFGDLDKGIPPDDVEQLRAAAAAAPVDTDVVRYPDADHGFHCDDRLAVFNPTAAADAWQRALAWFDGHLTRTPA